MKKINLFTAIIDTKPGENIFYDGMYYTIVDVVKETIESSAEDSIGHSKLTLTLSPLEPQPNKECNNISF